VIYLDTKRKLTMTRLREMTNNWWSHLQHQQHPFTGTTTTSSSLQSSSHRHHYHPTAGSTSQLDHSSRFYGTIIPNGGVKLCNAIKLPPHPCNNNNNFNAMNHPHRHRCILYGCCIAAPLRRDFGT
jgi:hypothetical protein